MRYADRSTPSGSVTGFPLRVTVTDTPPLRAESSRASRSASPGCGAVSWPAGAQHAQHAAQLGQPGQRAGPDLAEALHQLRRRIGGLVGRRLGLDRDHRHVVGDHVVQLPGDALPLLEQRALAGVPALLLLELAHAAAPHPDHDAEEDGDRGQEDGLGHDPGIDERRPGHGDGRRGDHDPRPAADRHRVQAQAVDECARHRDVRPAERARRDHQAGKDDGRRGNRPRAEREPRAQHERRADDEREQDQQAGRVVAVVAGVLRWSASSWWRRSRSAR